MKKKIVLAVAIGLLGIIGIFGISKKSGMEIEGVSFSKIQGVQMFKGF